MSSRPPEALVDRLHQVLADGGPQTPRELAERTGAEEDVLRRWLRAQVKRGRASYDAEAELFSLTAEQMTATTDREVTQMAGIEIKSFDTPDEVRRFEGNGHADVVNVGGRTIGRGRFEPGWRWSANVKPIAGTDSCQVSHLGYCLSGRMKLIMDDGSESECGPGDVVAIPPGHDGEVVGDEPCIFIDFGEYAEYAKRH